MATIYNTTGGRLCEVNKYVNSIGAHRIVLDKSCHNYSPEDWDELTDKEKETAQLTLKISLYDDLIIDIKEIFAV